jgi:aspartate 1-decarboxylase
MRFYLARKIHLAKVTKEEPNYIGSITVDEALAKKAGFENGELVHVWDLNNGERIETYIIFGKKNSGEIIVNGPATKKIKKGHKIIIAGFELSKKPPKPKIVLVDEKNRFLKFLK